MPSNREAAYAALFERMTDSVPECPHYGRRFYDFDVVPAQPALLVIAAEQEPDEDPARPTKWELHADVIMYVRDNTAAETVETQLHGFIDQIIAGLQPVPGEANTRHTTLGGVVERAQLGGAVRVYQGIPDDQAIIVVPVSMLMANL